MKNDFLSFVKAARAFLREWDNPLRIGRNELIALRAEWREHGDAFTGAFAIHQVFPRAPMAWIVRGRA